MKIVYTEIAQKSKDELCNRSYKHKLEIKRLENSILSNTEIKFDKKVTLYGKEYNLYYRTFPKRDEGSYIIESYTIILYFIHKDKDIIEIVEVEFI